MECTSIPFENFNFDTFWNDTEYALEKYVGEPPTDDLIIEVEKELGYKLPDSYLYLMKQHNGGIPFNLDYPTKEATGWAPNGVAINGIMGLDRNKSDSLCGKYGSRFWIEEWEYPDTGVAICSTPTGGHDMIFLDYSDCGSGGEPKVVHIDQENDYKITFVSDNFESFIRGLIYELPVED